MRRIAAVLGLSVVLFGCPKDDAASADDRLLKKLQAEKDRLEKGGELPHAAVPAPIGEANPLAARAAMPDVPKSLALPGTLTDFTSGKATFHLVSVETSHHVAGEKLSLTSDDFFFRVTLAVHVVGGGPLDLTQAKLVAGTLEYPLAKDAQRLAGTRELSRSVKNDEKIEAVLFFEAPVAALGPGLKLVVAGGDGVTLQ